MSFFNGKKLAIINKLNNNDIKFIGHLSFLELACLYRHYKKQTGVKINIFTCCFKFFPDFITFLICFIIVENFIFFQATIKNKSDLFNFDCLFFLFLFLIYLLIIKASLFAFLSNYPDTKQEEEMLLFYMRNKYKIKETKKLKKNIKNNKKKINENNRRRL